MRGGWSGGPADGEKKVTVCLFRDGRIPGVDSFATVGLSDFPLKGRKDGRDFYLEIMACAYPRYNGYGPIPGVLEHVAGNLVAGGSAILRGDVVPLGPPIAEGGELAFLYAANPVYFDDSFSSVLREDGRRVAVVWLIPIGDREADYVQRLGWQAFEEELARVDPDLLDLMRPQVV
jgi:hypothetical protein